MKTKVHGSIENSHKEKLNEYEHVEVKLKRLQNKLKSVIHEKETKQNSLSVFDLLAYDDQIHTIRQEIEQLQHEDSVSYLLKVTDILKRYSHDESSSTSSYTPAEEKGHMNGFVTTKTGNQRGQLYQEYNDVVNNHVTVLQKTPGGESTSHALTPVLCCECDHPMTIAVNETHLVCDQCGVYQTYFEPSVSGLTYEQEIHTETNIHFAYKRINHLRELLSQLQAKETSDIPDSVLDKIRAEFRKARIQNTSEITQSRVKSYLKKLGLNKYYEHTRQITNCLNGKPPPVISNALYENFINMFTEIQEPFEKVCPKSRKNFFSYNYVLYKFCELLGEHESMQLFPLLKSREKLYQQDCIWKDICHLLGWPFYKSV